MPITITRKGQITLHREGEQLSSHTDDQKAIEAALAHAEAHSDGTYRIRYPEREVKIHIASRSAAPDPGPADTQPPCPPTGLTATVTFPSGVPQVALSVDPPSDPLVEGHASGMKETQFYRDGIAIGAPVSTGPGPAVTLTGHTIGAAVAGDSVQSGSDWTLSSAASYWYSETHDSLHFRGGQLSGDFELTMKVDGWSPANAWAPVGLTVRESLDVGAKYVAAVQFPLNSGNGTNLEYRATTDGATAQLVRQAHTSDGSAVFLRLVREVDLFSVFWSKDGNAWASIGSQEVPMTDPVWAGIGIAKNDGDTSSAVSASCRQLVISNLARPSFLDTTVDVDVTYSYTAKHKDLALNLSAAGAAVSASTASGSEETIIRNLGEGYWCQSGTDGGGAESASTQQLFAKGDIFVTQGKWQDDFDEEATYVAAIKAIRPIPWLTYCDPAMDGGSPSANEINMIPAYCAYRSGGNPNWVLKDATGGPNYYLNGFGPMTNLSAAAGTDSFGKRYLTIYTERARELLAMSPSRLGLCAGLALDDFGHMYHDPASLSANNNVAPRYDGVSNSFFGAATHREGVGQGLDDMRAAWSGICIAANVNSEYYANPYSGAQGLSNLPTPYTAHPAYGKIDIPMEEGLGWYRFGWGPEESGGSYVAGSYQWRGAFFSDSGDIGLRRGLASMELCYRFSRDAATNFFGRKIGWFHQQIGRYDASECTAIDWAWCRAMLALCCLHRETMYGVCGRGGDRPIRVDELNLKRGTWETTGDMFEFFTEARPCISSDPNSVSKVRDPDLTAGGAKFYMRRSTTLLVVIRLDRGDSSDTYGSGSAVSYDPRTFAPGRTVSRPNASTYVHPDYADLAMTGQDTSLNNGAAGVTSSSLKPYYAEFFVLS